MGGKTSAKSKNEWIAKAYDRINLTVPKGQKNAIQAAAQAQGESVNEYIKKAVEARMEREKGVAVPPLAGDTPPGVVSISGGQNREATWNGCPIPHTEDKSPEAAQAPLTSMPDWIAARFPNDRWPIAKLLKENDLAYSRLVESLPKDKQVILGAELQREMDEHRLECEKSGIDVFSPSGEEFLLSGELPEEPTISCSMSNDVDKLQNRRKPC